jgi:endonuclease/exonuclease/phosphatase family metal-dependent hydrolase
MLIDGNDDRGIDVGLLTRTPHAIERMRSHVDDRGAGGGVIFSRDCPEYEISVPGAHPILVLVNHLKSKGYGPPAQSTARRLLQAQRVKAIYDERRAEGWTRLAVVGDLNDVPNSDALAPLLQHTDLRDASDHPSFTHDARTGTFGTTNDKIDYLLLAPALFDRLQRGGINREGVWHGPRVKNPWPMLDTLQRPEQAASDHAAIWADLDV